jgi:hypothetical protein
MMVVEIPDLRLAGIMTPSFSQDEKEALQAAADIVGRTGASDFEVGYERDGVPTEQAGWYAEATYKTGQKVRVEGIGPVFAADNLVRYLLDGGQCLHCQAPIVVAGPLKGCCYWTREGDKWWAGCQNR